MRNKGLFTPQDLNSWITKALHWAKRFKYFTFLEGNDVSFPAGSFPRLIAASNSSIPGQPFNWNPTNEWAFGYWTYDCKNHLEKLSSCNSPIANHHEALFYNPEVLIQFTEDDVEIECLSDPAEVYASIAEFEPTNVVTSTEFDLKCNTSKADYQSNVKKIRNQILEGDYYEINYCIAPYASDVTIDPVETFLALNAITQSPFACLQKTENTYLVCSSPERFIKKEGQKIISQPIKGTMKRGHSKVEDDQLKIELYNNDKERAENVMIVDLVRNDLSKSSEVGSVQVDELFGIYTFPFWHQMISTVSGRKRDDISNLDIIKNAFPMGSMTGAPKVQAMKMIDEYEDFQRGLYSGTVGYFDPNGDFDFNVIIRSIIYDEDQKKITLPVGSAITYDSDPQLEWAECWLKAEGMLKVLDAAYSESHK